MGQGVFSLIRSGYLVGGQLTVLFLSRKLPSFQFEMGFESKFCFDRKVQKLFEA